MALANPTLLMNIDGEGTMEGVLSDGKLSNSCKTLDLVFINTSPIDITVEYGGMAG